MRRPVPESPACRSGPPHAPPRIQHLARADEQPGLGRTPAPAKQERWKHRVRTGRAALPMPTRLKFVMRAGRRHTHTRARAHTYTQRQIKLPVTRARTHRHCMLVQLPAPLTFHCSSRVGGSDGFRTSSCHFIGCPLRGRAARPTLRCGGGVLCSLGRHVRRAQSLLPSAGGARFKRPRRTVTAERRCVR